MLTASESTQYNWKTDLAKIFFRNNFFKNESKIVGKAGKVNRVV